jgi:hypothetical protein
VVIKYQTQQSSILIAATEGGEMIENTVESTKFLYEFAYGLELVISLACVLQDDLHQILDGGVGGEAAVVPLEVLQVVVREAALVDDERGHLGSRVTLGLCSGLVIWSSKQHRAERQQHEFDAHKALHTSVFFFFLLAAASSLVSGLVLAVSWYAR